MEDRPPARAHTAPPAQPITVPFVPGGRRQDTTVRFLFLILVCVNCNCTDFTIKLADAGRTPGTAPGAAPGVGVQQPIFIPTTGVPVRQFLASDY